MIADQGSRAINVWGRPRRMGTNSLRRLQDVPIIGADERSADHR
jgi:hypothetical protein